MKNYLVALTCLIVGFALGWLLRPSSKDLASKTNPISDPGGSILESTSSGSVQDHTSPAAGDAPKNLAALLAIFEDDSSNTGHARAYQLLSSFSSKELLSLAQSIDSIGQQHRHYWSIIQAITGRWSETDPESLFAHALATKDSNLKQRGISQAIQSLATRNRSRARALLSAIKDDELRRQASRYVIRATAKDNPKAALSDLQGDPKSHNEYDNLFMTWGAQAPREAVAHLDTITGREARQEAIQGLAQSWGTAEPQAALDWAMTLSNRIERRSAIQRILGTIGDVTKGAAMLESLDLKGNDRREAASAFANKAIRLDLDRALEWMETLPPNERSRIMASHLSSINSIDPERARQLFDDNMSPRLRGVADNIARSLAENDLPSAQAWVDSLPAGNIKDRAVQGIVSVLQNTDPQAAATYLDNIGLNTSSRGVADSVVRSYFDQDQEAALAWVESKGDSGLTRDLLEHWSRQDPSAAVAYANELEDSSDKRSAVQSIMSNWANIDPNEAIAHHKTLKESDSPAVLQNMIGVIAYADIDTAVDFYESSAVSLADEDSQSTLAQAANNLVDTWADFDAGAAANWAASLELPEARQRAIDEAASAWIRQDSMAASEWIGELPDGPDRDAAVRRLINHVVSDDPSTAFAWANTLGDESRRSSELRSVLSRWKLSDPNGALQALQSANLSNEAYNKLVKQFEQ